MLRRREPKELRSVLSLREGPLIAPRLSVAACALLVFTSCTPAPLLTSHHNPATATPANADAVIVTKNSGQKRRPIGAKGMSNDQLIAAASLTEDEVIISEEAMAVELSKLEAAVAQAEASSNIEPTGSPPSAEAPGEVTAAPVLQPKSVRESLAQADAMLTEAFAKKLDAHPGVMSADDATFLCAKLSQFLHASAHNNKRLATKSWNAVSKRIVQIKLSQRTGYDVFGPGLLPYPVVGAAYGIADALIGTVVGALSGVLAIGLQLSASVLTLDSEGILTMPYNLVALVFDALL